MRLHPRMQAANIAKAEFAIKVWGLLDDADLTTIEALQAVAQVQSDLAKILLRGERHPKHQHKADEACERKKCPGRWADATADVASGRDVGAEGAR